MSREDALIWLMYITVSGDIWPKTTRHPAPDGWRWVVLNLPYQPEQINLVSVKSTERITQEDMNDEH